jgi:hypothetical protein
VRYLSTTLQSIAPSQGSSIQFGTGSAALPSISFIGDTNTGIYSPAADTIAFSEGGVEAMRLDSAGNVGIGTSSPGNKLVTASSATNSKIEIQNTSTAASTSKTAAVQFSGTDTVGTLKESGDIFVTPADNNYVGSNMLFYIRNSDSVVEQARITSAGLFQFNSGYGSVATAYGCRAWVNFNGTGTVAIRASGNVSSITDNGTGDYTVNFTTAMPDVNYAVIAIIGTGQTNTAGGLSCDVSGTTTTAAKQVRMYLGNSAYDPSFPQVAFFR